MMTALTWLLTCASIVGVILNIQKKRASFIVWMFTNSSWAAIDFGAGIPAQGALFTLYFALAVLGYVAWRK